MAEVQPKPQAPAKAEKKKKFNLADFPFPDYVNHRVKVWDEVKKRNVERDACMFPFVYQK
jgi:hypothetical protein